MRHGSPAMLSLRIILGGMFGATALAAALAVGLLVGHDASKRLQSQIGHSLAETAAQMRDKLDRAMFERWRDLHVAATLPAIRDPDTPPEARRRVVGTLRDTYGDYAWIGFVDTGGIVTAATAGLLEGEDVGLRPWFQEGLKRPFVGDVHEALLLARVLPVVTDEPQRFVDVAVPVRAADGRVAGVLGAHVSWAFAREIERSMLALAPDRAETDILVIAENSRILLGPGASQDAVLDPAERDDLSPATGPKLATWADGRTYLSAASHSLGFRDYPGLGWTVLVRQDAAVALAPVRELQRRIALWGLAVACGLAALGWIAADGIARPLRILTQAAELDPSRETAGIPLVTGYKEVQALSGSLRRLVDNLRAGEERFRLTLQDSPISVYQCDRDLRYVWIHNPYPLFSPEDIVGKRDEQLLPPGQAAELVAFKQAILDTGVQGRKEISLDLGGDRRDLELIAEPLRDRDGAVTGLTIVRIDITDRKAAEARQNLLMNEVNHRVKNTLMVIQSIARNSLRSANSLDRFGQAFEGRLHALSATHNILTQRVWEGADLRTILEKELEPYRVDEAPRFAVAGPAVDLGPETAVSLALCFHELATNAAKYGALSCPGGRIAIEWQAAGEQEAKLLRFRWREEGGPAVVPPASRGFGTRLLDAEIRRSLGGELTLAYEETGLRCSLAVPLGSRSLAAA